MRELYGAEGSHPRLNPEAPIQARLCYLEFKNTENVFS